jgi:hypothetical protein
MLLAVTLLAIGVIALVYNLATPGRTDIAKDKVTAAALEQAKAALIGYALSVNLAAGGRPGDLPCPDTSDIGTTGASCGDAVGSNQALRIGRLPWKSLGLPDLRDGDGERLWYAVSNNFKYNTRTTCATPSDTGCLNSDTRGTITVRNSAGTVVYDGSNPDPYTPSGVIAVIIAPGAVLQRQDTGTTQNRTCTGGSCTAAGVCTSAPVTNTPKCNPINYLDVLSGTEDNAGFVDGSAADGFIQGLIKDASNNIVVNDRLIVITYNDLIPALERRVAAEAMNCLSTYAATAQNNGRYPWAAPITDVTSPYGDAVNTRFGRLPDTFNATFLGVGGPVALAVCTNILLPSPLCMQSFWPASCSITQPSNWWLNWKEIVFYGLAQAYQPADPISGVSGVPAPSACGGFCPGPTCCLLVDPPSPSVDKRVVVVVAGKRLSATAYPTGNGQPRNTAAYKADATNYLEGTNDNTATSYTYEQQTISNSFSDYVLFQ